MKYLFVTMCLLLLLSAYVSAQGYGPVHRGDWDYLAYIRGEHPTEEPVAVELTVWNVGYYGSYIFIEAFTLYPNEDGRYCYGIIGIFCQVNPGLEFGQTVTAYLRFNALMNRSDISTPTFFGDGYE